MASNAGIALRTYIVPLFTTRALRIAILLGVLFLGLAGLAVLLKPLFSSFTDVTEITDVTLERLRRMAVIPGVPLMAILLAEIPLRDGIRHRTLLYPLLGPVPRTTLAVVRTLATAALLAAAATVVSLAVRLLQGQGTALLGRELLAIWLGAGAYIALFGIVHLITRRGLIAGLAIYGLLDESLGRLPFALRNLSPSYHMRVLADQEIEITLPIALTPPPSSFAASCIVLVVLTVVCAAVVAILFNRKRLAGLC
jgi:hypothetical protein